MGKMVLQDYTCSPIGLGTITVTMIQDAFSALVVRGIAPKNTDIQMSVCSNGQIKQLANTMTNNFVVGATEWGNNVVVQFSNNLYVHPTFDTCQFQIGDRILNCILVPTGLSSYDNWEMGKKVHGSDWKFTILPEWFMDKFGHVPSASAAKSLKRLTRLSDPNNYFVHTSDVSWKTVQDNGIPYNMGTICFHENGNNSVHSFSMAIKDTYPDPIMKDYMDGKILVSRRFAEFMFKVYSSAGIEKYFGKFPQNFDQGTLTIMSKLGQIKGNYQVFDAEAWGLPQDTVDILCYDVNVKKERFTIDDEAWVYMSKPNSAKKTGQLDVQIVMVALAEHMSYVSELGIKAIDEIIADMPNFGASYEDVTKYIEIVAKRENDPTLNAMMKMFGPSSVICAERVRSLIMDKVQKITGYYNRRCRLPREGANRYFAVDAYFAFTGEWSIAPDTVDIPAIENGKEVAIYRSPYSLGQHVFATICHTKFSDQLKNTCSALVGRSLVAINATCGSGDGDDAFNFISDPQLVRAFHDASEKGKGRGQLYTLPRTGNEKILTWEETPQAYLQHKDYMPQLGVVVNLYMALQVAKIDNDCPSITILKNFDISDYVDVLESGINVNITMLRAWVDDAHRLIAGEYDERHQLLPNKHYISLPWVLQATHKANLDGNGRGNVNGPRWLMEYLRDKFSFKNFPRIAKVQEIGSDKYSQAWGRLWRKGLHVCNRLNTFVWVMCKNNDPRYATPELKGLFSNWLQYCKVTLDAARTIKKNPTSVDYTKYTETEIMLSKMDRMVDRITWMICNTWVPALRKTDSNIPFLDQITQESWIAKMSTVDSYQRKNDKIRSGLGNTDKYKGGYIWNYLPEAEIGTRFDHTTNVVWNYPVIGSAAIVAGLVVSKLGSSVLQKTYSEVHDLVSSVSAEIFLGSSDEENADGDD